MIFMMLAGYQEPFVSSYVMREDDAGSLIKEGVLLKVKIIWNSFHFFPLNVISYFLQVTFPSKRVVSKIYGKF